MSDKHHTVSSPAGLVIVTGEMGTIQFDTVRCVHCGAHWVHQPGSGKQRGFCGNCNGFVCGAEACMECVPAEQKLENIEAGRPLNHRRILVPCGFAPNSGK